jgi:hypothetical protein
MEQGVEYEEIGAAMIGFPEDAMLTMSARARSMFPPRVRRAEADLKHQELRSGDLLGYRGNYRRRPGRRVQCFWKSLLPPRSAEPSLSRTINVRKQ